MTVKQLQKQIELLERKIAENQDNLETMQNELQRLKFLAFEEEFREEDNRQLLQG